MKDLSISQKDKLILQEGILHNWDWVYIMSLVGILALYFADKTSLLSYGYSLLLLTASCIVLCRHQAKDLLLSYHFYLFFAIIFYLIFKNQFPTYLGLSGQEGGTGTDDCRFYAQIVGGRGIQYTIAVSTINLMPYSIFLKFLYPFKVHTPLNIVVLNILFSAYLPIYVRRLSILITNNLEIGDTSFWLSLLCPFTLYFGCIILRDVSTATFVIAGLTFFLEKKWPHLAVCAILLIWIRFGTLAFLLCGILMLYRFQLKRKTKTDLYFSIILVLTIVAFNLSFSFLQDFSNGKLASGVIRATDDERYGGSTIGAIIKLPFPLNIILSTIFFLIVPMWGFPRPTEGHYLVGTVFQGFLTPFFMFFLWNYIFNSAFVAFLSKTGGEAAKKILFLALVFALLLGTISLQSRHKTVLFPILCIMAAYGKVNYNKRFGDISRLLAFVLIGLEIALAINPYLK